MSDSEWSKIPYRVSWTPTSQGWQPIETAPVDTCVLIGWHKDLGGKAYVMAMFDSARKAWCNPWTDFLGPTHWMPLPEPPELAPVSDRTIDLETQPVEPPAAGILNPDAIRKAERCK